jgi:uncharacterized protein (DUF885 family)
MNKLFVFISMALLSCNQPAKQANPVDSVQFNQFLDNYYEGNLKLSPLEATLNGDNRYNDQLTIDISEAERAKQLAFFQLTLDSLKRYDDSKLNDNDKLSYDVLKRDLELSIEGFSFHDNYMPVNQFSALPLLIGQLASGQSAQPFKTVQDYDNWLKRVAIYANWLDSAIVYSRKGIEANMVLPKSLVVKIIPQMESMIVADPTKSLFYAPIDLMPASFSDSDKVRLKNAYVVAIAEKVTPAYKRINDFLKQEYLPKARATSGLSGIPDGVDYYKYLVRLSTTTSKTPGEIYNTGLNEVKRIRSEMEKIKSQVGFIGDLAAFLEYLRTDKRFMPYKTPPDVLNAFYRIYKTMQPNLRKMFTDTPKTKFEIRQTEAFRSASASAEYNQGTPDGSRPGIFYVPILDAATFNVTSGMESLFLHEAIPGHHYQISLQQENTQLPKFRRFGGNNAYVEGWALYCESLGKELGLYTDPYQYMGALGDEIHRAIRLVVDVAIHTKNMTREEAIKYMMENEAISEQGATAEIERYMAIPAQALGYKIGALKIRELRTKYEKELGSKFDLADFHTQVLKDGSLPLDVLESKLDKWANAKK